MLFSIRVYSFTEERIVTSLDSFVFAMRMFRLLLTLKFALTFEGCRLTLVLVSDLNFFVEY